MNKKNKKISKLKIEKKYLGIFSIKNQQEFQNLWEDFYKIIFLANSLILFISYLLIILINFSNSKKNKSFFLIFLFIINGIIFLCKFKFPKLFFLLPPAMQIFYSILTYFIFNDFTLMGNIFERDKFFFFFGNLQWMIHANFFFSCNFLMSIITLICLAIFYITCFYSFVLILFASFFIWIAFFFNIVSQEKFRRKKYLEEKINNWEYMQLKEILLEIVPNSLSIMINKDLKKLNQTKRKNLFSLLLKIF